MALLIIRGNTRLVLPQVASYIPQLERMNPNYWGVSLCTVDGQRFSIGDVKVPYTIQSCRYAIHLIGFLEKLMTRSKSIIVMK